MINYGIEGRPLKVEVSFRKKVIESKEVTRISLLPIKLIKNLQENKILKPQDH
jgi:hypothetical protein